MFIAISQLISERLASLPAHLPLGIVPVAIPLSSSSSTVLTIGLSSDTKDLMALRSLVDWTIVPRLSAVSGVTDVALTETTLSVGSILGFLLYSALPCVIALGCYHTIDI